MAPRLTCFPFALSRPSPPPTGLYSDWSPASRADWHAFVGRAPFAFPIARNGRITPRSTSESLGRQLDDLELATGFADSLDGV